MCADEMTTGSIMATPGDRGILANRSHAFNIAQPRFKKMFPEYSKEAQVNLPNMGETKKEAAESSNSKQDAAASSRSNDKKGENKETGAGDTAGKVWTCTASLLRQV